MRTETPETTLSSGTLVAPSTGRSRWVKWSRWLRKPHVILGLLLAVVLAYLVVVPLISLVYTTVTVGPADLRSNPGAAVGDFTLSHWQRVLGSQAIFLRPLKNTLVIGAGAVGLVMLLGAGLAWLTTRTDVPWSGFIGTLALFPYVLPSWAFALAWLEIFQNQNVNRPSGLLQYYFGIEVPSWLVFGPVPIIIVMGLHYFPFVYLLVTSALRNIDSQLEETGELLGSSRWTVLRRITLPIVLPALLSGIILGFSRTIGSFATPALLGGPERYFVLSSQIFSLMRVGRSGQAFIMALTLVLLASVLVWLNNRVVGKRRSFVTIAGKGSRSRRIPLGKWRWPLAIGTTLFLVVILITPVIFVAYSSFMKEAGNYSLSNFTLDYWIGPGSADSGGEPGILRNSGVWHGAYNSVRLGLLGGLLCGLIGLLIGYVVVRERGSFLANALDRVSFIPMLVPSIAFGAIYLSLFSVPRGPIPSLYGTFAILVLVMVANQLPYASRTGISAMHQIGPELEEAAAIQGSGWFKRFRAILFPLARPGFITGTTIVMITTMRELSLFILLMSPDTRVLTALTFTYAEVGLPQLSNALMTFLILIIAVLMGLLKLWEVRADKGRTGLGGVHDAGN